MSGRRPSRWSDDPRVFETLSQTLSRTLSSLCMYRLFQPWRHLTRPSVRLGVIPVVPGVALPYTLGPDTIDSHLHLLGLTGAGKSTLLAHYATSLILQGRAVSVIDPHADLATDILRRLIAAGYFRRPNAYEHLRYLDFTRSDRFLPFNILKQPYSLYETARLLVEACLRAWPALADGQAPAFENILLASATVLIANQLPVTHLSRLLTNRSYREGLLAQVHDPEVIAFFRDRFDRWGREAPLMIESTLRRAFLLTYSPALRFSLGQQENALPILDLMNQGVSLICNLGGLDEQTQRLLGSILTVSFETAALARARLPETERTPHTLIVDEFAAFSAQSEEALSRVLSAARKYHVNLVLAHQTFGQLSARLRGGLYNTVPIAFRLAREDAVWMAPRFGAFDPLEIKHVIDDHTQMARTHPLFYSVQETYERWARELMDLRPREFYIRVHGRTVKLRAHRLARAPGYEHALRDLQTAYAHHLLAPPPRGEDETDAAEPHSTPRTTTYAESRDESRDEDRSGRLLTALSALEHPRHTFIEPLIKRTMKTRLQRSITLSAPSSDSPLPPRQER